MKYPRGTKLHIYFNDETDKPMHGLIHEVNEKIDMYDIEWIYSHDREPVRSFYTDKDVHRITHDNQTRFRAELPTHFNEDLFTL